LNYPNAIPKPNHSDSRQGATQCQEISLSGV
jgi:hypothetical protein